MRWDEVNEAEKTWDEISWDETGWHRPWWQWDAMSNFQEKLRCDEIRWNEKRFKIKKWHQIDKSRACCCEARKAWQQPIGTVFAPLYRPEAFQIWNFHPRLDRELLVWMGRLQARMGSEIHNAVWWFEIHVFLPYMDGILNCPKLWVKNLKPATSARFLLQPGFEAEESTFWPCRSVWNKRIRSASTPWRLRLS